MLFAAACLRRAWRGGCERSQLYAAVGGGVVTCLMLSTWSWLLWRHVSRPLEILQEVQIASYRRAVSDCSKLVCGVYVMVSQLPQCSKACPDAPCSHNCVFYFIRKADYTLLLLYCRANQQPACFVLYLQVIGWYYNESEDYN